MPKEPAVPPTDPPPQLRTPPPGDAAALCGQRNAFFFYSELEYIVVPLNVREGSWSPLISRGK